MKKSVIAFMTVILVSAGTFLSIKAFATEPARECPGGSMKCCTDQNGVEYKIDV